MGTERAGGWSGRLELYIERGFEQTTVTEIALRAGLTQRTFFRHFADKREVLFAGAPLSEELIVGTVASVPDCAAPIDAVSAAVQAAGAADPGGRRTGPGGARRSSPRTRNSKSAS